MCIENTVHLVHKISLHIDPFVRKSGVNVRDGVVVDTVPCALIGQSPFAGDT